MEQHNLSTILIETAEDSLKDLLKLLIQKFPWINPKTILASSINKVEEADFIFIEIKNLSDIPLLNHIKLFHCKTIVVVNCIKCMKAIFSFEIASFIIPPFGATEIQKAMDKVRSAQNMESLKQKLDGVFHLQQAKKSDAIIIPNGEGFEVIRFNEIVKIMAERAYCTIYLIGNRKITVSKSLKEVESRLPNDLFMRCHLSHVININSIRSYNREDGGQLLLTEGSRVPLSKHKKDELVARFI
jgi:two-component system LytT family response regulator